VTLLINNAGINRSCALLAAPDLQAARAEMETNYFGTLAMCRAFAPVLKANGGGAIVNMLSILGRVNLPLMGSLCASKAAGLSLTQGVRAELAKQGTTVIAVMPGAVDTDMSRDFPPPKMPPREVADAALAALERGHEDVYPGDMAQGVSQGLAADPKAVEKQFAAYLPG
jgi:short-subunit dehydrogenase